jgi:hypothetical protein
MEWGEEIPPIQLVGVNKTDGLPGDGIAGYLSGNLDFASLSRLQKRALVSAKLQNVYLYPKWNQVLDRFGLPHPECDFDSLIDQARTFQGGGESEQHRAFKEWIAAKRSFGCPLATVST